MKINNSKDLGRLTKPISALIIGLFLLAATSFTAYAAITPILTLSYFPNSSSVEIAVNADAYAQVILYNNGMYMGAIGSTDRNGNFYSTLNGGYNVQANYLVYVVVDGAASPQVSWPSYNGYNNNYTNTYAPYYPSYPQYSPISLSQNTLSLTAGQSSSVSIYGNGNYYISNDSNSSVASAFINSNSLTVYTYNGGGANITVCGNSSSCATLYINVTNVYIAPTPTYYNTPPVISYPPPVIINYQPPVATRYYQPPLPLPQPIYTRSNSFPFFQRQSQYPYYQGQYQHNQYHP